METRHGRTLFGASATLTTATPQVRLTREYTYAASSGTDFNVSADTGYHFHSVTGTAEVNISGGTATNGARMCIVIRNGTGGAINATNGATSKIKVYGWANAGSHSIQANGVVSMELIYNKTRDGWLATLTADTLDDGAPAF